VHEYASLCVQDYASSCQRAVCVTLCLPARELRTLCLPARELRTLPVPHSEAADVLPLSIVGLGPINRMKLWAENASVANVVLMWC
jgi:hypothetical protein